MHAPIPGRMAVGLCLMNAVVLLESATSIALNGPVPACLPADENANLKDLALRLVKKQDLPKFEPVQLHVPALLEEGRRLAYEQEMVNSFKLSQDYFKRNQATGGLLGLQG